LELDFCDIYYKQSSDRKAIKRFSDFNGNCFLHAMWWEWLYENHSKLLSHLS